MRLEEDARQCLGISCFFLAIPSMPVITSALVCCEAGLLRTKYHQQILGDYLSARRGNMNLAEIVFRPDIVLLSDRLPSTTGKGSGLISDTNRNTFIAFVQKSE